MTHLADVAVVGAGPVGLHAALKAMVLNQSVVVLDRGPEFSRVSQAPAIANVPGAPGISGPDLLALGRRDLERFQDISGRRLLRMEDGAHVVDARREGEVFVLDVARGEKRWTERARVVVLATGVVDRKPGIEAFHREGHATLAPFAHRGEIGYCLLCEGWSLEGRRVGIVGSGEGTASLALDVAGHFGGHPLVLSDGCPLPPGTATRLRDRGIPVEDRPIRGFRDAEGRLEVIFAQGPAETLDKALFSLGWYKVNNEIAVLLGAATTPEGYVRTDENSEVLDTRGQVIRGLFAVGDVRAGRWKQVVVGWGDAETAVITAYAYRLPRKEEHR